MWNHVLATIIGFGLLLGSAGEVSSLEGRSEQPPAVEMVDLPPELGVMVEWAVDLFDQADLELPPLRFVHHAGAMEPCRGRAGLHHVVGGVSVIELCAAEASWVTQVMILHETSHAWAEHQLTPERKATFQELRGWAHWRDHDSAAWHENGTEQAAEIMVWGLVDRPIQIVRIHDTGCADLEAGYLALTGEAPLNGFRDFC